jgi:hypothetical protein
MFVINVRPLAHTGRFYWLVKPVAVTYKKTRKVIA